jgi:hypothetical protein
MADIPVGANPRNGLRAGRFCQDAFSSLADDRRAGLYVLEQFARRAIARQNAKTREPKTALPRSISEGGPRLIDHDRPTKER